MAAEAVRNRRRDSRVHGRSGVGFGMRLIIGCVLSACALSHAQSTSLPATPEGRIAAIEKDALTFPRAAARGGVAAGAPTCTVVPPDQIVFPSTKGDPSRYNVSSGEFSAGSISFGWGPTMEIAKMPLVPKHADNVGNGLRIISSRIDPPGETVTDTIELNSW